MPLLAALVAASSLGPLGVDWWIILGGWIPGIAAVAIAVALYLKGKGSESDE